MGWYGSFQTLINNGFDELFVELEKKPSGAPLFMKARGENTDSLVLTYVQSHIDSTIKEIAENNSISNGRADHSVQRLSEKGLVEVIIYRRKRGLVKKVRAVGETPEPLGYFFYPLEGLDASLWDDEVTIYALSRSAIGVSPVENSVWMDRSILHETTGIKKDDKKVGFTLPPRFIEFYELPNSRADLSGSGAEIIITIDSTIIPVIKE